MAESEGFTRVSRVSDHPAASPPTADTSARAQPGHPGLVRLPPVPVPGEYARDGRQRVRPSGALAATIQRKLRPSAVPALGPADMVPPAVHETLRRPGAPLDPPTRSLMERRLGADFGHVRVHTDAPAAASARAVNALAYTAGNSIVFGSGRYAPRQHDGQRLLAHELTHTVQQGGHRAPPANQPLRLGAPTTSAEHEAHAAEARDATDGGRTARRAPHPGAAGTVQRKLVGNEVHGNADKEVRTEALDFINWVASKDASVAALLKEQDILLLVMVGTGEGDQETQAKWKEASKKTQITITMHYDSEGGLNGLRADLLHELILHASPATVKHMAAVPLGKAPAHPATDEEVEAEEEAEHTDAGLWYTAAAIALSYSKALMERVIADAASHDEEAATEVVTMLKGNNLITGEQATELIDDLINA